MGWKDKVKGALFEEDGSKKTTPATSASVPINGDPGRVSNPIITPNPVATAAVNLPNEKFLAVLTRTIDEASPSAWKQFALLLMSLSGIIKDEAMLYQAALKAAEAQGLSLATVTAAASQRLELLKKEQVEFERNLATKAENNIPDKEAELSSIDQQLANLQVQMDSLRRQRDQLAHDIGEAKNRLEHSRAQFAGAQAALKSQLEQELARIQTHLKA